MKCRVCNNIPAAIVKQSDHSHYELLFKVCLCCGEKQTHADLKFLIIELAVLHLLYMGLFANESNIESSDIGLDKILLTMSTFFINNFSEQLF